MTEVTCALGQHVQAYSQIANDIKGLLSRNLDRALEKMLMFTKIRHVMCWQDVGKKATD